MRKIQIHPCILDLKIYEFTPLCGVHFIGTQQTRYFPSAAQKTLEKNTRRPCLLSAKKKNKKNSAQGLCQVLEKKHPTKRNSKHIYK